jgi:simple sugar transport system permease protein
MRLKIEAVLKNRIKGDTVEKLGDNLVWVILIGALIIMGIIQPAFFTVDIIRNIFIQAAALGVMTIGLSHTLMVGEIDLSTVGAMAFSAGLGTFLMNNYGIPWFLAVFVILFFGCLVGFVNGVIITKLRAAALIETIAMNLILIGGLLALTGGRTFTNFPAAYNYIGKADLLGIPILPILLIVIAIIFGFIWSETTFGRSIYATGGNVNCARASGINIDCIKIAAFVISAGLSAFSGWMYSSYMGAVPASFGSDMQMYALASAVIGGVSLTGGIGKIQGVLGGVLLITIFQVGLQIMGISPYLVNTTGGIMIMIAVIIDALKNKYRAEH